jgi:hypothetical protein
MPRIFIHHFAALFQIRFETAKAINKKLPGSYPAAG